MEWLFPRIVLLIHNLRSQILKLCSTGRAAPTYLQCWVALACRCFFSKLCDMFCFAILCVFLFCVPQVGRPQFICGVELLSLAGALKSDRRLFLQSEGCKSNMPGLQRIWNIVLMSWLFSKKGESEDLLPIFSMLNVIITSQSLLFDEIIVLLTMTHCWFF